MDYMYFPWLLVGTVRLMYKKRQFLPRVAVNTFGL